MLYCKGPRSPLYKCGAASYFGVTIVYPAGIVGP
jgi:hypothetical protein